MISLRCARQTRTLISSHPNSATTSTANTSSATAAAAAASHLFSTTSTAAAATSFFPPSTTVVSFQCDDVESYFREWFLSRNKPVVDRIFEILRKESDSAADLALSRFNLPLSEALVLDVLNYAKKDVLSCLKFFDWTGRQPGFYHTRATFNAIFRVLSQAKLMSLMLDFLQNYMKQKYVNQSRYYNVLVIGYSVAGKSDTALQLFGRMRFQGVDLDRFAYHVLLNALCEDRAFDVVEMVANQIRVRGLEDEVTHSIMMKSFCKQRDLEKAERYLRGLVGGNAVGMSGVAVGIYVNALCRDNQFEKAALLVEELREMGGVSMECAYGVWIKNLVEIGNLHGALEFLKDKQSVEGYVPEVFRYNLLIWRLLRENRLEEVCDLLIDMKERGIFPDGVTMNTSLCFLCKAGMMDVAMKLYDSRAEFGLSVSGMAYNYLINTLVGDGSINEAYRVLRNSVEQGYFPGKRTLSIVADALCREQKLDKMKELILSALDSNIMPHASSYDKFISALCRANKVEAGYVLHGHVNKLSGVVGRRTYFYLIRGFNRSRRGDIAARLLIEMQEKGYKPSRKLFRDVICCLCEMDSSDEQFFRLLELQFSRFLPSVHVYNSFIDGAGHAGKPELARKVLEMMLKSGFVPDLRSHILVLQSYLKSEKITDALLFFSDLSKRRVKRKVWHTMIVGLCKVRKPEQALEILENMKENNLTPSIECYEELIKYYCEHEQYHKAVDLINDMTKNGRFVSSFIGNILLLHSLKTRKIYDAWAYSSDKHDLTPATWMLGELTGIFSGCISVNQDIEDLEKLIEQCFPFNIFTHNLLLRRLSQKEMEYACRYFDRLCEKGFVPNRWSYDIIVHGFAKLGRTEEAKKWMEEMFSKGFELSESTKMIL